MSFSEKILSKSNSYNFYKNQYEKLLEKDKENKELKKLIEKRKIEIQEKNKEIKSLTNDVHSHENTISDLEKEMNEYRELFNSLNEKYQKIRISADRPKRDLKEINIAYVLNTFPELSQTFVLSELKWLVENNYNVMVFYKKNPLKPVDFVFDIKYVHFESEKHLMKLLLDNNIEFMHTHFAYPICCNFTYPIAECLNIPFTVFAHAFDIFTKEYQKINKIADVSRSELCLAVYTLSDFHRNYLINQGVNDDKIVITKQATDYEISEFHKKEDKIRNIVSISRFVEKKGFDVLIDAAKLLEDDDLVFEIYGFGKLENKLKGMIEKMNLKNISIKGELNPEDVKVKLKESDLIVVPCKVAENGDMDGIPTIIFESMAVGLPVLTTSVSAIPEIIEDGENGFIIEPENPELLAEKIREIVSLDSQRLYEIRCRAQRDVESFSSVEQTMQTYIGVLENHF